MAIKVLVATIFLALAVVFLVVFMGPFYVMLPEQVSFFLFPLMVIPVVPLSSLALVLGGAYIFVVSDEERTTRLGKNIMLFPSYFMSFLFLYGVLLFIISVGILLYDKNL